MREIRRIIIITLLLLPLSFSSAKAQKEYRVKDVPNIQLRDRTQFVSDPEGVLSINELTTLNQEILEMRDSLTVQVAIVILPAIDGSRYGDAREFANELFNDWGIGIKNADNGLLILLLTAEGHREITFETGYAVEGVLTDGLSKLIQTKVMVPHFKQGEWGEGLISGLTEIRKAMEGDSELLRAEQERQAQESAEIASFLKMFGLWNLFGLLVIYLTDRWYTKRMKKQAISYKQFIKRQDAPLPSMMLIYFLVFTIAFFIYIIIIAMIGRSRRKETLEHFIRCEHCGHQGLVKYDGATIARKARIGINGLRAYQFHCDNCGYTHEELIPFKYIAPMSSSRGSGPWGGGGGFGGGGGSWGGGMSGGGGASTRF